MKPTLLKVALNWFNTALCILACILVSGCLVGCATRPGSNNGFDYVPLVESAAYTGTVVALTGHPEKRAAFGAAERALAVLGTSPNIGFADLQAAFKPILERNVKELRDARTQLLVGNAVILVDAYAGRLDASTASVAQLQAIALAADRGILRALSEVP